MVIEWLKFRVKAELREKFVQLDEEIWTKALRGFGGYLGKQIWLPPQKLDEVVIVGWWESRAQWKAISPSDLEGVEAQFLAAMGKGTYELIEEGEYQVRKFTQNS